MLPVVAGPDETRRQIVIYCALLVPLALLPAFMGFGGAALRAHLDRARRRLPGPGAQRLPRARGPRGRPRRQAAVRASRSSICSGCLPRFSSSGASAYGLAERGGRDTWRTARQTRMGTAAQDALDRHRAGAGCAGRDVLRRDHRAARRQRDEQAALAWTGGGRMSMSQEPDQSRAAAPAPRARRCRARRWSSPWSAPPMPPCRSIACSARSPASTARRASRRSRPPPSSTRPSPSASTAT